MTSLSWISSNPDYINQMIRNTQVTLSNNYNDLDNIPIIKITSTTNNPQKIWELKEGLYMINGVAQVDNSTSYEVSNLLISMTARLENGKYILSAFIPYLRGLFEYILKTNSTEYEQHQKIVLMIKDDTLTLDNETIYTPIENYHPATKKYVDDKANEIIAELDRMGVNKENLESLSKENRIRDIKLQALLSETSDRNITIEENVRYFDMPLSIDSGIVTINEIVGETLVNVCDQEESVVITKSYTVENENHIALQGEYDGSCRPVVYGNTLVNHNADWDGKVQTGVETSASGTENVQVEGIKGQEVSVVVEGNTVLNHALGKTSAVVSSIESENEGNYVDLTVANDMSSVVEIEGRTMYYNNDTGEYLYEFVENSNLSLKSSYEYEVTEDGKYKVDVKVTGKNKIGILERGYINSKNGISDDSEDQLKKSMRTKYLKIDYNKDYYLSNLYSSYSFFIAFYDKNKNYLGRSNATSGRNTTINKTYAETCGVNESYSYIRITNYGGITDDMFLNNTLQLEEGTVATSYEPYFESTKTFYLNSPLLEGDKIVTKNGKVYHYHKMGKVVLDGSSDENWEYQGDTNINTGEYIFDNVYRAVIPLSGIDYFSWTYLLTIDTSNYIISDKFISLSTTKENNLKDMEKILLGDYGRIMIDVNKSKLSSNNKDSFKLYLRDNPVTVVYKLASPYYELIDEYNNTILNIPRNVAHLTHTSTVPVNNTVFTNYKDELNVLEPNTQYRVMFDCDKPCSSLNVTLGGTTVSCTSTTISGTKSFLITTPTTLVDKNLVIDGIGRCGIDNIRIFKGDIEYDYVKGLWSGYEERRLENLFIMDGHWNLVSADKRNCAYIKPLNSLKVKPNTMYTVVLYNTSDNYTSFYMYTLDKKNDVSYGVCNTFTTIADISQATSYFHIYGRDLVQEDVEKIKIVMLEGDWTDNPPTYEEVMANEGKYAVKVKLDTNANVFGKGGRL